MKKVEGELNQYLAAEKIEIFAQPLPLDTQLANMDFNNPGTYDFAFEIGLKPKFEIKILPWLSLIVCSELLYNFSIDFSKSILTINLGKFILQLISSNY